MISEGFVTNGAKVYISSRDGKACDQAAKELTALGTYAHHIINTHPIAPFILPPSHIT